MFSANNCKWLGLGMILIFLPPVAYAQVPYTIEWQRCLGGSASETAYAIERTNNGGYVLTGSTSSSDGDVSGPHFGNNDLWVVLLESNGTLVWERCYGGSGMDIGHAIKETGDGGYIVVGTTASEDGNTSVPRGGYDLWVLKLDAAGLLQWQQRLGGSDNDQGLSLEQVPDSGFLVAGWTFSNDGDVTGNQGQRDAWLVKLDPNGSLLWQRCLGGPGNDLAKDMVLTSDGGYVIAGASSSNNVPIIPNVYGPSSYWVVKLASDSEMEWERNLGGPAIDDAQSIRETEGGGFVLIGSSRSLSGDVSCNQGESDNWVVKLNTSGNIEWDRCLGGSGTDTGTALNLNGVGNCYIAGITGSSDGDVSGNHGSLDGWIVEVNLSGELLWQLCIGGSGNEWIRCMSTIEEDGFVMAGATDSNDGDVSGNHGGSTDLWVVKLAPLNTGIPATIPQPTFTLFPNPATNTLHVQWSGLAPHSLEVLDATGRLVYGPVVLGNVGEEGYALPVGALPAGLYAVRIQNATASSVQRFVKE